MVSSRRSRSRRPDGSRPEGERPPEGPRELTRKQGARKQGARKQGARKQGRGGRGLLLWGGGLVGLLALAGLAAPLLAPYDPDQQLTGAANLPPGTVVQAVELVDGRILAARAIERHAGKLVLTEGDRRRTVTVDQVANLTADGVADRRVYLLGTDRLGRDLASRLIWGARVSLTVALLAVGMALTVGISVGACAATGPPAVDGLLMRCVDAVMAFPRLFLLLALAALLQPSNTLLILILGGTAWMGISRIVRGEILSVQQRDYVLAARAVGVRPWRILLRHLLPPALSPVFAFAALLMGGVILNESALAFLGLGLSPPQASWGNILSDGRDTITYAWWTSTFSGLAIAAAVIGLNLLGDGLRDWFDPR